MKIVALLSLTVAATAAAQDMFPFQLPWDDASPSITNVSWLNDKPAGGAGFVHVKDGHLFAGEKRLRIFGVNVCFGANFPDKEMAPKVAARMAKFGINCVRFHHMDMFSAPSGIFAKDGRTLDAGQMDKLDWFIAKLKENGIYADLNLHVSRVYPDRPKDEKKANPEFDKGVDNYCAAMIALQRDYARDLLTHVNPYTGKRYADEPCVALVEINNENALGFQWFAGQMDDLPQVYREELESLWGAWVTKKYGNDDAAKKAWSEGAKEQGSELLSANRGEAPGKKDGKIAFGGVAAPVRGGAEGTNEEDFWLNCGFLSSYGDDFSEFHAVGGSNAAAPVENHASFANNGDANRIYGDTNGNYQDTQSSRQNASGIYGITLGIYGDANAIYQKPFGIYGDGCADYWAANSVDVSNFCISPELHAVAGNAPTIPKSLEAKASPEKLGASPVKALRVWNFEQHGGAEKTHTQKDGVIAVTVDKVGTENWHVQFNTGGLVVENAPYEVKFRVRAPKETSISVGLQQSHEPWKVLGSANAKAGTEWRDVSVTVKAGDPDNNARLSISGMGLTTGTFEFFGFSLRTAGTDGSLVRDDKGRVAMVKKRELSRTTMAKQRDWQEFVWDTETVYWNGMRDFLKKELGVKAPIVGTQGFWSPGHVQAGMDVIDSHAYWQHPDFKGRGWNPDEWSVKNIPMAGAKDGGTLPGLAAQRVAGKPFICTEYNHAAPNTYSAETFPIICAFAALQDWDGVFAFSYSHRGGDAWSQEHFNNFFDIDRHPAKMATLPGAVVSFRRGDVPSAEPVIPLRFNWVDALELAIQRGPMIARNWEHFRADAVFSNRFDYMVSPTRNFTVAAGLIEDGAPRLIPSKALVWKEEFGIVELKSWRSFARIGRYAEPWIEGANSSGLEPGKSRQNWACYQITAFAENDGAGSAGILPGPSNVDNPSPRQQTRDGLGETPRPAGGTPTLPATRDFSTAKRFLITATGTIENTDMRWKNAEKTSVGRDWGKAPVLVEGPAAKIELPTGGSGKFKAWAMDERGQRKEEIPVTNGTLEIGPKYKTLWYEVERQ